MARSMLRFCGLCLAFSGLNFSLPCRLRLLGLSLGLQGVPHASAQSVQFNVQLAGDLSEAQKRRIKARARSLAMISANLRTTWPNRRMLERCRR